MNTLKLNRKNINQQVAEQLAQKMKLEARLRPILKKFLRNINADIANRYELTGQIGTFQQYFPELVGILRQHYRLVKKRFLGEYETKATDADKATNLLMAEFIDEQAPRQATFILETTASQANKSLLNIITDGFAAGIALTAEGISRALQRDLNGKVNGRTETIAMLETQMLSERTKLTEAMVNAGDATAGNIPLQSKKKAIKTWHIVGDSSVRDTHQAANGQTKLLTEPFIVGGSLLMYPGDWSLGADGSEIYGCRCISIIRVEA